MGNSSSPADRKQSTTLQQALSNLCIIPKTSSSGSRNTSQTLTTFHLFGQLPTEIRQLIWGLCRLDPQIIRLKEKTGFRKLRVPKEPYQQAAPKDKRIRKVFAVNPFPPLVHACGESRDFAMKYWYIHTHPNTLPSNECGLTYFFDPARDYIYIGCDDCQDIRCSKCDDTIPYNAMELCFKIIFNSGGSFSPMNTLIEWFPNAQEIIIVKKGHSRLTMKTQIHDLHEVNHLFKWQRRGRTLTELYATLVERYNNVLIARYQRKYRRWERKFLKPKQKRLQAAEESISPEDTKALSILASQKVSFDRWVERTEPPKPVLNKAAKVWAAKLIPNESSSKHDGFLGHLFRWLFPSDNRV